MNVGRKREDDVFEMPQPAKRLRRKSVSFNGEQDLQSTDPHPPPAHVYGNPILPSSKTKYPAIGTAKLLTPHSAYATPGTEPSTSASSGGSLASDQILNPWSHGDMVTESPPADSFLHADETYVSNITGSAYGDYVDEEVEEEDVNRSGDQDDDDNDDDNDYSSEEGSEAVLSEGKSTGSSSRFRRNSSEKGFSDWQVGTRYDLKRILGHGSYGEVAEAIDTEAGGTKVAIKRILNVFEQDIDAKRIYREMYILRSLNHSEVIKLLDVVSPKDYESFTDLYLVFEYVDTDLYKLILSNQYLSNAHIQTFLYQMLVGLKHLHSAHVIHRDMKPANILLNEDCTLKICDFGLSRVVGPEHMSRGCACPAPAPGELCKHKADGSAADSAWVGGDGDSAHNEECNRIHRHAGVEAAAGAAAAAILAGAGGSSNSEGESGMPSAASSSSEGFPSMPEHRQLKRQLTKHVVTRWYRAPELILLQDYSSAVDVWSLGCIFAELLSMQKDSVPRYQDRLPLFPGKSCFPLSADVPTTYNDKLDQLNVIFDVIGTPCGEDIEALGEVKQYLTKLKVQDPRSLEDMYCGASPSALALLRCMLQFNPAHRITVNQALEHEYLANHRNPEKEVVTVEAIPLGVENLNLSKDALKRTVYEEVQFYENKRLREQAERLEPQQPQQQQQHRSSSYASYPR